MLQPQRSPALMAAVLILLSLPVESPAGECTQGENHYLSVLERVQTEGAAVPALDEAIYCLQCTTESGGKWAGPIAAARFESCRHAAFLPRLAAACIPLLSDSTYQEQPGFVLRYEAAALLASYGIAQDGGEDIFAVLAVEKRARFQLTPTDYMALAVLRDPRTVHLLSSDYESLPSVDSPERLARVSNILNCLYHIPGDSALVLARAIGERETAPQVVERAHRVLER